MDVKSFRARSLPEALAMVRRELGPDAAVLHTRELSSGVVGWLAGSRQIEVIATSDEVDLPSRVPSLAAVQRPLPVAQSRFRRALSATADEGIELDTINHQHQQASGDDPWRQLYDALVDAGADSQQVAGILDRVRRRASKQQRP